MYLGVIVHEDVDGAASGAQPGVTGTGEAEVGGLCQDADFDSATRSQASRPGGIVDEDDLDVGVGPAAQAVGTRIA